MDYKKFIEIIETEKKIEPSPFLGPKILHRMESRAGGQDIKVTTKTLTLLQPLFAVAMILLAVFTGVLAGRHHSAPAGESSYDSRMKSVKSELFVSELKDEDKTMELYK